MFRKALCFDDVMLVPEFSEVTSRKNISLTKTFGKKTGRFVFNLNLPIFGSPMDTVCGPEMVSVLAQNGAMGILHRYNNIAQQVAMVNECVVMDRTQIGCAIGATKDYLERALVL